MPAPIDAEGRQLPRYYSKPGQLRQEYLVDDVLRAATEPGAAVLARVASPNPQQINPRRLGYRVEPLTITDVLATDRWAPTFRSWTSGASAMPYVEKSVDGTGGVRNANTQGFV